MQIAVTGQMGEHVVLVVVEWLAAKKAAATLVFADHNAVSILEVLLKGDPEGEHLTTETALIVVSRKSVLE